MYVAVEKGLSEVVRTLVTRGLFGINEATTTEPSGATALHVAILHGQSHLIPMLLELGADVNQLDLEKFCSPLIMAIILQVIQSLFGDTIQCIILTHCLFYPISAPF